MKNINFLKKFQFIWGISEYKLHPLKFIVCGSALIGDFTNFFPLYSILDNFPGATNNYLKMFISEVKTSHDEEFSPRTLYYNAVTIQMYLKDKSKGKFPIVF